jgi:capsular exopolysaccharide synthesis family protein
VDLPLLGMIPHLDDVEEDIEDMRLAFLTNPKAIISEAFRQARTTLMFSGTAEQRRSILISSAMPEDGRTTVALNLAHAIATGGKKVLVVDANFRQPMIRNLFPMCPDGGLSTTLVGQADWRSLVHHVEENLDVMASGPHPPNPADLLGSNQMRRQIEEFYEDYDQVIFDSSPCLVVSDAVNLSTMVEGAILVVRAGVNTYGIVQRARDMITRLGTPIFGVVLNGVRVTAGGYLRKNYETFYEYREQPQLTAEVAAAAAAEGLDSTEDKE